MWNARYLAYSAAHSVGPDLMLMRDRLAYPGGCMAGFIAWTAGKWREWEGLTQRRGLSHTEADHAEFTEWLQRAEAA